MTSGPPEEHLNTQEKGVPSPSDQTSGALPSAQEPSRRRLNVSPAVAGLLGVLALGAAVGGWYLTTNGNAAQDPAVQDPAISSAPSNTAGTAAHPMTASGRPRVPGASGGAATPAASAAATVIPVSPAADTPATAAQPTSVTAIPPLSGSPASGSPGRTDGSAPATATGRPPGAALQAPGSASATPGINPADPAEQAGTAPNANPFRPLRVTSTAQPGAAGRTVQTKPLTTASAVPLPSVSLPTAAFAGAIPMPTVPLGGLNASPGQASGSGAAGQLPSPGGQTVGVGGALPLPTISLGGLARPLPTLTAAPRPKPIPRVGLNAPGLPDLTSLDLAASTGTDLLTYSRALQAPGAQPALLTSATYGYDGQATSPGAPVSAPVGAPISALAAYLAAHAVKFTAVVLGPLNTAVFSTSSDTLVLNTGAALPDSGPVLTRLTGSAATLSLGSESITLDLTTGAP